MSPKYLAQVRVTGEEHARLSALVAITDTSVSAVLRDQLEKVLPKLLRDAEEAERKRLAALKTPAGKITESAIDEAAEQLAVTLNRSEPITLRIDELYSARAGAVLKLLQYLWQSEPDDSTAKRLADFGAKYLPRIEKAPVPANPIADGTTQGTKIRTNPRRRSKAG